MDDVQTELSAAARRLREASARVYAFYGKKFDPRQPRDRVGRWTDTPGGGAATAAAEAVGDVADGGEGAAPGVAGGGRGVVRPWVKKLLKDLPLDDETRSFIEKKGLDQPLKKRKKGKVAQAHLGDFEDTKEKFTDPVTGAYDQKRKETVHDPLIDLFLRKKKAVQNPKGFTEYVPDENGEPLKPPKGKPRVLFLAGGNASGKSVALYSKENSDFQRPDDTAVEVNFDLIKARMPEFVAMSEAHDIYGTDGTHFESADIAARLLEEAMDRGLNVVVDASGNSNTDHFEETIARMKAHGYNTEVLMVDAPLSTAIPSMVSRGQETGRYVPIPILAHVHRNSTARHLEWRHSKHVDRFKVYRRIGKEVTLAAEGGGGQFHVQDSIYDDIVAKGLGDMTK